MLSRGHGTRKVGNRWSTLQQCHDMEKPIIVNNTAQSLTVGVDEDVSASGNPMSPTHSDS